MVYTKVYIVAGFIVDKQFAKKHRLIENDGTVKTPYSELLHQFPCCSILKNKKYILGRIVHTYYRKSSKGCGAVIPGFRNTKCDDFTSCEKCFNLCFSASGDRSFDIDTIFNNFVGIPSTNICYKCYNYKEKNSSYCEECGLDDPVPPEKGTTPAVYDIKNFYDLDQEPRFYLMIDDCIYCS